MTENRTAKEIHIITEAIYPLCGWGEYINSDKELYMQDLWDYWVDKLDELRAKQKNPSCK